VSSLSQLQDTETAPNLCDAQVQPSGAVCFLPCRQGERVDSRRVVSQVTGFQMADGRDGRHIPDGTTDPYGLRGSVLVSPPDGVTMIRWGSDGRHSERRWGRGIVLRSSSNISTWKKAAGSS